MNLIGHTLITPFPERPTGLRVEDVETTVATPPVRLRWAPAVAAGSVAVAAVLTSLVLPLVSPLLVALVAGILIANLAGKRAARWSDALTTRFLLRTGVVLLGLRLSLAELGHLGLGGVVVAAAVVATTFGLTWLAGRRMAMDPGLVALVAAGCSVCGAAAIAAVESGIRRRPADVAVAIALVTAFGTLMIPTLPLAIALLGLDDVRAGVWIGASVHEVAQVVASAALVGPDALAPATTVKLARVAMLGAVFMVCRRLAGRAGEGGNAGPPVPAFVLGFLCAVALRSSGVVPPVILQVADLGASLALAAAMFGLGATVTLAALKQVERRAVALAGYATSVATAVSLAGVWLLV